MASTIPTWLRPNHTPGGPNAFVLYGVFGQFDLTLGIDREKYRSAELPYGFEFVQYDRHKNPAGFNGFFKTAGWTLASQDNPELGERAYRSEHMAMLRGFVPDSANLNYLRDSIGIVTHLLDRGGITVFDPQMLYLWTAEEWRTEVFEPNRPVPHQHISIFRMPERETAGRTQWIHTRGMRLFGRPDLCVRRVGPTYQEKVVELFNKYIEYQANGGEILEDDVVTLDGLPPNGVCSIDENLDNAEFNNAHVEIRWPDGELMR
jgi:hypothetical protein